MNSSSEEIDRLLARMIDSELSADERRILNEHLRHHPEDLGRAADLLILESILSTELRKDETGRMLGHDIPLAATGRTESGPPSAKESRLIVPFIAAAAVVLACLIAIPILLKDQASPPTPSGMVPVARLIQSFEADFGVGGPSVDGSLNTGTIEVTQGSVEIAFRTGPKLVIESPARIDIQDDMSISLLEGRIRGRTPSDAAGFVVTTPMARLESLSGEFGASVQSDGSTQLHVFTGELRITELADGNQLSANEGFAREWQQSGPSKGVEKPDFEAFENGRAIASKRRHLYYRKLLKDPDVLAFYDFRQDTAAPDTLVNRIKPGKFDGTVHGAAWVSGRFQDEGGLLFNGENDRVAMDLPKQVDEVTMATWIRVDRFDSLLVTILNTKSYDRYEHHWQILSDGSIRGGLNGGPEVQDELYRFNSANDIVYLGQWTHLAFTLNSGSGVGKYYANGTYIGEGYFGAGIHPSFGSCDLGHWSGAHGWITERNLQGMMDEFLILNREMTPDEIQELHRAGSPDNW